MANVKSSSKAVQISPLDISESTKLAKTDAYNFYMSWFFGLWMNSQKWKGYSFEQNEFANEQLWTTGSYAIFNLLADAKAFDNTDKLFALCPFAPNWYNIYNYPTGVYLINLRGVSFIPDGKLFVVGENVELCYALHNHASISSIVDIKVRKIVEVEMTMRTNLNLQKMPFALKSTPENYDRLRNLYKCLENDAPALNLSTEDLESIDVLDTKTDFIVTELQEYKMQLINEVLTFLGIDNIGGIEKKERLIKDEANSNNDLINDFGDSIQGMLKSFCERANKTLGLNISVEAHNTPEQAQDPAAKAQQEQGGSNDAKSQL